MCHRGQPLPSLGSHFASWLAEDGTIQAQVHRDREANRLVPVIVGDLWLTTGKELKHSTDSGKSFETIAGGATCVRINDDQHQFGFCNVIIGDPRVYGRAYLGTGGRGILYGEPK